MIDCPNHIMIPRKFRLRKAYARVFFYTTRQCPYCLDIDEKLDGMPEDEYLFDTTNIQEMSTEEKKAVWYEKDADHDQFYE